MSTYTQDITHLIGKINTNLPDNDTQAITAARIRDAMGAVAYNYDLYVLKTDLDTAGYVSQDDLQSQLADYVTQSQLSESSYVTASQLEGLVTDQELQEGMQSVLDDSYAYVVDKISDIPVIDPALYVDYDSLQSYLGSYVSKTELSEMGYITEAALDGLATEAYVADYVAEHAPIPDLSAYVTKTELSEAGYLTAVPSEYVTDTELSLMGYITEAALGDYVTETELSQAGYVTQSQLSANSYVTETNMMQAMEYYASTYYVSKDALDQASYVTQNELSNMGYITTIPSEYVTDTELSNMGYVTQTDLSAMSYATTSDLTSKQDTLVSGTNIKTINNTSLLGSGDITITGGSNIEKVTQAQYDAMEQAGTLDPDTLYVITDAQSADLEDYATLTYLETYYVTQTDLSSMSYATTSDLTSKQDTLVSGTNIKTINNESLLGSGNIDIQSGAPANYSRVLTFTAQQNSSWVRIDKYSNAPTITLQYSTDGGSTWNNYTLSTAIQLSNGNSVKFKGINDNLSNSSGYYKFVMGGKIAASGDVTSLLNDVGGDCKINNYGFQYLFSGCSVLTSAPDLPSTIVSDHSYYYMFNNCTSLIYGPTILPALKLGGCCYQDMFYGCTALTKGPELPATTLQSDCYANMFYGCTSLEEAPVLPAQSVFSAVYYSMFNGCTSLKYVKAMLTSGIQTTTFNWLKNVAATGVFVMNNDATWDPDDYRSTSGIPTGWTVYRAVSVDTDDVPESYVEDNGKGLQVVNGVWEKVSGLLTSSNLIYDSTTNTLTINV